MLKLMLHLQSELHKDYLVKNQFRITFKEHIWHFLEYVEEAICGSLFKGSKTGGLSRKKIIYPVRDDNR